MNQAQGEEHQGGQDGQAGRSGRDLGLASRAVPPEELDTAIEAEIAPYLTAAPGAVAASKALLMRLGRPIDNATIAMTASALADQWESAEAAAGIAAFFDRRPAPWTQG